MNVRLLVLSFLLANVPLVGAPARESVALQEMRIFCDDLSQKIHHQTVEIELLQEKIHSLENSLTSLQQETNKTELAKDRLSTIERRLLTFEKTQETLASDLKLLKNHLNDSSASLATCQVQLSHLEKQLSQDVKSLKSSLQSMITLLQKGDLPSSDKVYIVKPGDSLGKIALESRTEIKRLKELNHLSTDRIYIGQKLCLP